VGLDFVAEQDGFGDEPAGGLVLCHRLRLRIPTLDIISTERNLIGNIVGTYTELAELMVLASGRQGHLAPPDCPLAARGRRGRRVRRRPGSAAGRFLVPSWAALTGGSCHRIGQTGCGRASGC
jgi:hypothetical protein